MLSFLLLTLGLWGSNARTVCDQQVHHCITGDVDSGRRHHAAQRDGAAGRCAGGDGAGLAGAVSAHVALELGGCLAVHATQVAHQDTARGRAAKAAHTVLPLLAVVLLGMDTKVCQGGEAWWAEERRCSV